MDDLKNDAEKKEKTDASKDLIEPSKEPGRPVKDVVVSTRLTDSPAIIVVDENEPTVQMQQILKSMGQPYEEAKPILEVNVDDPMVKKIAAEKDQKVVDDYCSVLLDQALLTEG
jgi:molecular chaperone HtpG